MIYNRTVFTDKEFTSYARSYSHTVESNISKYTNVLTHTHTEDGELNLLCIEKTNVFSLNFERRFLSFFINFREIYIKHFSLMRSTKLRLCFSNLLEIEIKMHIQVSGFQPQLFTDYYGILNNV